MKAATTIFHLAIGLLIISLMSLSPQASAQDNANLEPSEKYSREELTQMLAPIALYPDALLSQVLMASTYPIEVIEADRWLKMNQELKDEALDAALLDKDWDPSVKAACHFPSILALMSERITETTNLGNAFLAQEAEVMDMVQELRAKAKAQGNLTTTSQQKVIVEKETIIIEPADPRVIYVPYYDPFYIYGPWWYPAYPPYYWGPPGVSIGVGISYWPGFYFGFAFGSWSYFDWHNHYIHIHVHKRPRFVRHDRWIAKPGRWHHAPRHRRGVAYRDKTTARKYGQYPHRSRKFRRDTRGFPEHRDRDRTRIDRDRRGDDRTRIDRERKKQKRLDRDRQVQERVERDRQMRERPERDRQVRPRIDQERQRRERVERGDRQVRERPERDRQVRPRIDQERQRREKVERGDRQMRKRPERDPQERARIDQERQRRERVERARADQKRRKREQAARSKKAFKKERTPGRSRENVFNRVEDGRKERESSKRGRVSRQGRGKDSSDRRGSSGRSNRDGRNDRDRNRR